ncbi:MAG: YdeI/OmpD-associated family protein [Chitinophagaceae bacterium]
MISFTVTIQKFNSRGEKTGWTYIEISAEIAEQLKPGHKTSFRVKGKLDHYIFKSVALLPMGGGSFIMALKADVRKAIGKRQGAQLKVMMGADETPFVLCPEMMDCLADEPIALVNFNKQPGSHQKYFSNWINSAKTAPTKAKRIAQTVTAMVKGQNYGEMIKSLKKDT